MKFLCMVVVDESQLSAMLPEELQALGNESLAYDDTLRKGGHFIAAQALQSVTSAKVLRRQGQKVSITDGPFAETKEQIGGFILLEARDMNEALDLAAKIPGIRLGGVEVRPIQTLVRSEPA